MTAQFGFRVRETAFSKHLCSAVNEVCTASFAGHREAGSSVASCVVSWVPPVAQPAAHVEQKLYSQLSVRFTAAKAAAENPERRD